MTRVFVEQHLEIMTYRSEYGMLRDGYREQQVKPPGVVHLSLMACKPRA